MKRLVLFLAVLGLGSWAWGQYGPYFGGGSTVAGSAMTGMANTISAKGEYNLNTSAAAINMTQAQKQEISNRQQYTNTYFEMRETNRQARAAEAAPRPTAEQIARLAREAAPKPLSPGDANDVSGILNWPPALQQDVFAADRENVETIYASYTQMGSLTYADQTKARQTINGMAKNLKAQIKMIPGTDYIKSRDFLKSLMFTTCKCQMG